LARRRSLRTAFGFLLSLALALVSHVRMVAAEPLVLDIASAAPAFDQRTGEPLVSFRLTEASRLVFADFTGRNVGRKVDRRVDGRVMTLR
jgi:SecDF, P1 head subdomain